MPKDNRFEKYLEKLREEVKKVFDKHLPIKKGIVRGIAASMLYNEIIESASTLFPEIEREAYERGKKEGIAYPALNKALGRAMEKAKEQAHQQGREEVVREIIAMMENKQGRYQGHNPDTMGLYWITVLKGRLLPHSNNNETT